MDSMIVSKSAFSAPIQHRINMEFRGPPSQQMGTIFYFAFSTLVFSHKERLESNLSRFAVIIWVFVVLILQTSYTASLTSMLTVLQLQPEVTDLSELIKNGKYIGYHHGSFVAELLKQQLNFEGNKLKNYSSLDEYAEALARGSKNGGVAAIFDEIPYLKLFLSENCQDYTMVGRTYKTDGFGFVFPRGSPLVSDVSRAILNVTEGDIMAEIEKKWFGNQTTCPSDTSSDHTSSKLNFQSFSGLFLITGCVSSLALLIFLVTFLYREWGGLKITASQISLSTKIKEWARYYDTKDLSSHTFKDYAASINDGSSINDNNIVGDAAATTPNVGSQSPVSVNLSDLNFGSPGEGIRSFREG
ncbi:glutamate receptor 2.8-like [Asparagus officinalis]|uniref:glutamate receptor 2.8-like n=1 Tax=Asparagus officinalis TaxID=4686 RepID=UPI00098E309E|nr:glutamate receptor 2.8-like [Asparagus officinalis]